MSMSDPIADMFTRIRNGQLVGKESVVLPASKMKKALADLLLDEGYISGVDIDENGGKPLIRIDLKYYRGKPVIELIQRVSKPGRRVYKSSSDIPRVRSGLGVAIVSTSRGIMTDRAARSSGQGGEIVAFVA